MKSFRTAFLSFSLSAALAVGTASAYTSVNVPGTLFAGGDWDAGDAAQRLHAMPGNPHVWTNTLTAKAAEGQIKFAADGSWDVNWGGVSAVTNLPATDVGPLSGGGNDISVSGLAAGASYLVAFNDLTATFSIFPAEDDFPDAPVSVRLIGEFNSYGDDDAGLLAANGDGTWSVDRLDLDPLENAYLLRIGTATSTNDFGLPVSGASFAAGTNTTAVVPLSRSLPFGLAGERGGEFTVAFDPAARTLSFTQTKLASGDATMVLSANFIGSGSVNMVEIASKRWRSEHFLTNSSSSILSFTLSRVNAEGEVEKRWTAAAAVTNDMQGNNTTLSGKLAAAEGDPIPVFAKARNGRYLLYFNERTGEYTFARRYNVSDALLGNAGFETVFADGNGTVRPSDWSTWSDAHANAVAVDSADGFPVHAGTKAVLLRRLFADWEGYTGVSQDIGVAQYAANGLSLAVSAYFRKQGTIDFSTGGVLVEMRDSSGNNLSSVQASASEFSTASWTYLSCVAPVPSNAATAHVSFRLDNVSSTGGGGVIVDDPEVKIAGTQTQNFNAWGALANFARRELDWYASSAKTTNNVSTAVSVYGDLIISQVVEGRDNNKAVELYNGTASPINLANYSLVQYDNGATSPTAVIPLSGTVPSKETFVVSRPAGLDPVPCTPAITSLAQFTSGKLTFNGDDVLALRKGTQVVDAFGTVSAGASGSYWAATARDATATRKSSVTNASAAFDLSEWTFSATDDISGLGGHAFDGDQKPSAYVPSGYSCILNANAFLKTSELPNGAGSASFYALCDPPTASVDVIVQTSSSYEADLEPANATWRSVATNTIQPGSDWQFFASDISSSSALFVRFLATNGSSSAARARLDDIALDDYSAVRRYQYFTDWGYTAPGTYAKAGWTLANGSISATNGESGSRCALLADGTSSLTSPFFEGGVGDTSFFAQVDPDYGEATAVLKLLVSTDRGETWEDTGSRATVGTEAANLTLFAYCSSNSAVRIAYEDEGSDVPVFLDSVYVPAGVLRPSQDFEDWTAASYGDYVHQGWQMTDGIVNATNGVDGSRCGSMIDTVGKHATIRSSYLPGIVGGRYAARRANSSTKTHEILVQASSDGTEWTTVATHNVTNFAYQTFFFQLPANATWHFVRFYHQSGGARTDFDDILLFQPSDTASVSISAALSPAYLTSETTALVTGTVIPENTAEVLEVVGLYTVDGREQPALAMDNPSFGAYESKGRIGPFGTGTKVAYAVRATYAGFDADGSGGYSTNTLTSAWRTNVITTVSEGSVWINEINAVSIAEGEEYGDEYEFDWDTGEFIGGEMHEFVEICGLTNVDVSGWSIELRAGLAGDIIKLGGNPTYARYVIPDGTVLGVSEGTIRTADGSHALLILGDREKLETKHGLKVAIDLDQYVPDSLSPGAAAGDDHIFAERAAVVALLDAGGNTVDAVACNGFDSTGVATASASQNNTGRETMGISLGGTGSLAGDFDWDKAAPTPGAANAAQTLEAVSTNLLAANFWHVPSLRVVPRQAQYAFTMRSPLGAAMTDAIDVTFGWDAKDVSLQGVPMTLFYRSTNAAANASSGWQSVPMAMRDSFDDREGNHYYAGTIPAYAYPRCSEIEYYIFVQPAGERYGASYLGADGTGETSTNYTATTVQDHPFRFTLAFDDEIVLGPPEEDAFGRVVFDIENNDTVYPVTNFRVRSAPSMLTPVGDWATNAIAEQTLDTGNGTGRFVVEPDESLPGNNRFYRLDLLWP